MALEKIGIAVRTDKPLEIEDGVQFPVPYGEYSYQVVFLTKKWREYYEAGLNVHWLEKQ